MTTHEREYLHLEQRERRYMSLPFGYFIFTAGYSSKAKKEEENHSNVFQIVKEFLSLCTHGRHI